MIKPVNLNSNNLLIQTNNNNNNNSKNNVNNEKNKKNEKQDSGVVVDIHNTPSKPVTYGKGQKNISSVDINEVWNTAAKHTENFRVMIKEILAKQGIEFNDVLEGKNLKVDEKGRELAQQAISENGELGINKVTKRIVGFAKILANGDKGKIPELRDAIKQGFAEAEKILGELPEISKKTYESVMKELDAWENEGNESVEVQIEE